MNKARYITLVLVVAAAVFSLGAGSEKAQGKKGTLAKPFSTMAAGDYTKFDVNNISTFVRNNGSFNRDPGTGASGFEWPKGTGNTAIYASGLWLAGKTLNPDTVRAAIAEYSYEFDAGPILAGGIPADPGDSRYRMYKIKRGDNASNNPDYANWPVADGAPVDDAGNPLLLGDMTVWCVFNEASPSIHVNVNAPPLGVEVQLTAFAYNRSDALGNAIFYKWKIINKGGRRLDSTYICVWADPDLGDSGDDYVGCDTTLGIGFCYNAKAVDGVYGTPPATGFDFLQGPLVPSPGDTARLPGGRVLPNKKLLKMTSFLYYNNDASDNGNPSTGQEVFNYMKGVSRTAKPVLNPAGRPSVFMYSGDPSVPNGPTNWVETDGGGDRRFMMSAGPFTLAAGDTQEIVAGNLIALGSDYHNSVVALKSADASVQTAYDLNFQLAPPPDAPAVTASLLDQQILLTWGNDAVDAEKIESTHTLDPIAEAAGATNFHYDFQGYVVYQVANASGDNPQIVQTFDLPGNLEPIYDNVFDASVGGLVYKPVKFGNNNGVQRTIRISKDKYTGATLSNNRDYYFVVTAYSYNQESVPRTLESARNVLTLRPGGPPGARTTVAYGDTIKTTHTGPSDGGAFVLVTDPAAVTGHDYKIQFRNDPALGIVWDVVDVTRGVTVVRDQVHQTLTGDGAYATFDGLQAKVLGPKPGMKSFEIPSGTRRFSPVGGFIGLGLEGFSSSADPTAYDVDNGTIGMAGHLAFGGIGTTLSNTQYHTVLLKLAAVDNVNLWDPKAAPSDPNFSRAYRVLRSVGTTSTPAKPEFAPWIINKGSGYPYQDYNYAVPFSAWDMETTPPTRLAVGCFENNVAAGMLDGRYWPPLTDVENSGPRELAFIYASPYTETPNPALAVNLSNNSSTPLMWVMVCNRRADAAWVAGDEFQIVANHVNAPADVFTFTAPGVQKNDALKKTDMALINAVPNPYFGANAYERNQFNRVLRFTNLPAQAKIRIFSLGGELVRVIDKDDATTTTVDWDLTNRNQLPIASGMYLAYIEVPGIGTKVLKLAVIMAEERLDNF